MRGWRKLDKRYLAPLDCRAVCDKSYLYFY